MTKAKALPVRLGLYFEEFEVGHSAVSPGRTVTEADIVSFAALSGDWNPIHTDAQFAERDTFGQRVAHGLLVMSITQGLVMRLGVLEGTALALREIEAWKFSLPVFIGDTIRVRATVTETKPMHRLGAGLVRLKLEVLNQEDNVVQRGRWAALVKSRGT
ncbi:MAG: dehydratase [Anaerolineae bacterium SM23_84]|jgi:3-hydroxybutyryl-CoA dehydratase|nr:MAG: dehydratase [Anaerolineae bacterium SM23_84]